MPSRDASRPFPELVDGCPGSYHLEDSAESPRSLGVGRVDKTRRILWSPHEPDGRDVSLHELAHVRWSPRRLPRAGIPGALVMAVEDARINQGLERIGRPPGADAVVRDRVLALARRDLEGGDPGMLLVRAVASIGTRGLSALLALLEETPCAGWTAEIPDLVRETAARLEAARARRRGTGEPVASWRQGRNCARWLHQRLGALGVDEETLPRLVEVSCCGGGLSGVPGAGGPGDGDPGAKAQPGRLTITTAPLVLPCPPAPRGGLARAGVSSEGTELAAPHRFASDQMVFRRRARRRPRGGTVLIDVSGSMRLSEGDVDQILRAAPQATTVAVYSGRGDRGELRVVVREGLRAGKEHLRTPGRGNVVDLPALEWLAQQAGPRVWLSDGGVTGRGDQASRSLEHACRRVCRRAGIRRVTRASRAARLLARPG